MKRTRNKLKIIYSMTSLLLVFFGVVQGVASESLKWIRTGGPLDGLGYDIRYNFADLNI